MTEKLTRAEHHARAALLGRKYDPRDGTYCDHLFSLNDLIDCVTMEPTTVRKQEEKYGFAVGGMYSIYGEPPKTMPWEKEDG